MLVCFGMTKKKKGFKSSGFGKRVEKISGKWDFQVCQQGKKLENAIIFINNVWWHEEDEDSR